MKIRTITVVYEVADKDEEIRFLSILAGNGSKSDSKENAGVSNKDEGAGKKEEVAVAAYAPSCDRTKRALEAIERCSRVGLLVPVVLERWATAYPDVDLAAEIAKCEAWAESKNVTRTLRGWQASLNTWLSKEQDKTRGNPYNPPIPNKVAPIIVADETKAWIEAGQ